MLALMGVRPRLQQKIRLQFSLKYSDRAEALAQTGRTTGLVL